MLHARRFIAILTGVAAWCTAAATVAYAKPVPDPYYVISHAPAAPITSAAGTPIWQFLVYGALGVLLAVALVGLGYSLSRSRRSEPSARLRA